LRPDDALEGARPLHDAVAAGLRRAARIHGEDARVAPLLHEREDAVVRDLERVLTRPKVPDAEAALRVGADVGPGVRDEPVTDAGLALDRLARGRQDLSRDRTARRDRHR